MGEKAESEKGEGLAPVLSSKAKRRGRTRRGVVFNWPALRPVRVVGMQWSAAIIVGMQGLPHLALSRWWSTKGVFATKLRDAQEEAFRVCFRKWGPLLVHVFDRGYASAYWLSLLLSYRARFLIRWIKKHEFLTVAGERKKLWQIGQGKKYRAHKEIRDTNTGQKMPCDLWWTPLCHPSSDHLLYLLKARVNKGVMYLITNDSVQTEEQAWEIFFSYRRRWQIETSFRYGNCELALECPRLWSLDARLKLLGMVMLIYTFLLSLLDSVHSELIQALLRFKCHRTGKRCLNTLAPLYRLRWALSRLWDDYRPRLTCFLPPSDDPQSVASFLCSLELLQKNWG